MPDFWTHILGGRKMIERVDDEGLNDIIEKNNFLFNFACQGPDFLYYHKSWPSLKPKEGPKYAKMIHNESTKEMMTALVEKICSLADSEIENEKKLVYFLGFSAHYILDRDMHPLVFDMIGDDHDLHKILELKIDNFLVEEYWKTETSVFSPVKAVDLGNNLPEFIEQFYRYLLRDIFEQKGDLAFIQESYSDFKRAKKLYYSPFRFKYYLLKIFNLFTDRNIMLYSHIEGKRYRFLTDKDYENIDDYFNSALEKGAEFLEKIYKYWQGKINLREFNTLIPHSNFNGRKY
ncbi:MAG: zinc dependent phospholipase C family protein [Halanaerobiales bacterium]